MKRLSIKFIMVMAIMVLAFNNVAFSETTTKREVKQNIPPKELNDIVFPDWNNLKTYKLKGLEFNKSKEADLAKLYPFIKEVEEPDENIKIYSFSPKKKPNYLNIKIAFENGILSWIDFLPAETITISEFTKVLGFPFYVNKRISQYLDYYDYGNMLVMVDKKKGTVYSISKYSANNFISNDAKKVGLVLLPLRRIFNGKFGSLDPGITRESELKKLYPMLKPSELSAKYYPGINVEEDNESDVPTIYFINKGLEDSSYNRIELVFKNGLLNWIDIVPKNLLLKDALIYFGSNYKKAEGNEKVEFFVFNDIILTVSKKNHKVLNIGMLGNFNSKLKKVLPTWKKLNTQNISGIEIDKTTLQQFKTIFSDLISEESKEGNFQILKVSEGLSFTGYEFIYFIFKNNKLNSIDLAPSSDLKISNIIAVYGNEYDLDKDSSEDVDYYSFNNVIVSVNKETKIVNSIGLY